MPVDPAFHGSNWFLDPQNFDLYRMVGEQITPESVSLYDLTQGQLSASGGFIRDAASGRIVQPLRAEYPAVLNVMPTGQLLFQRETASTAVNSPVAAKSRYGAAGQTTLTLPNGEQSTFEARPWMQGQGQRTLIRELAAPGESQRFHEVRVYDEAGQAVEPFIPEGWRYATGQETLDRAIVKQLIKAQSEMLKEMVDLGMVDENGDAITDVYEAAGYVAAEMSVTPSLTSVLIG